MNAHVYGNEDGPGLMLLPFISLLKDRFHIVAVEVDGFILGEYSSFTSIDDQAGQVITFVKENLGGRLDCAYGLSMGGEYDEFYDDYVDSKKELAELNSEYSRQYAGTGTDE